MPQTSSLDAHLSINTQKFLQSNDSDDRTLDLISAPSLPDTYVGDSTDSENEPNIPVAYECYPVVDEDNISFGTTNRGGRELYMCGYTYQVKGQNLITTRWRCVVRTPSCPAVIYTNNIDDKFHHWNGSRHFHQPDENRELIKMILSKIKSRVLVEPHPVLAIAEEEIRNAKMNKLQLAAMPLPSQLESMLQKHRRKNIPPLPSTIDFEIPSLYQYTWSGEHFVLADIKRRKVGGRLIIFSSYEQFDLLLNSTTWFCDGTFKTRPIIFDQVYIIQCLVGEDVLPVLYALTSNRKRKTYQEILGVILKSATDKKRTLAVQTIVSDYEKAWLRAVEMMLPNVHRLGCWFHFTQACYRNIQQLGLSTLYDDDPDIRLILRKFLALALVPRDEIELCFRQLCNNVDHRIEPFVQYFQKQWMIEMEPDLWSVGDSSIRTNNSSESYNRRFAGRMLHSHPNIWKFIHVLKNEEYHMIQKNIHQLTGDTCGVGGTRRKRAKQALKKTCQIRNLHRLFTENKKTLEQLILGLSFLVGEPVTRKKKKKNN